MDPTPYWVMALAVASARSTWWSCAIFSSPVIIASSSAALSTHACVGKARAPPAPPAPISPATLPVPGIHRMPAAPSGVGPPPPPLEQPSETDTHAVVRRAAERRPDVRQVKRFGEAFIRAIYVRRLFDHSATSMRANREGRHRLRRREA